MPRSMQSLDLADVWFNGMPAKVSSHGVLIRAAMVRADRTMDASLHSLRGIQFGEYVSNGKKSILSIRYTGAISLHSVVLGPTGLVNQLDSYDIGEQRKTLYVSRQIETSKEESGGGVMEIGLAELVQWPAAPEKPPNNKPPDFAHIVAPHDVLEVLHFLTTAIGYGDGARASIVQTVAEIAPTILQSFPIAAPNA